MDKDIAAAAIERLEAEKRRRIDEKVARGEAIFVDLPVVVVGAEDADEALEKARAEKIAELRATGERREILFDDALINVIATGVPGRDEGDGEVMPIATALEDKTSPSIADFSRASRRARPWRPRTNRCLPPRLRRRRPSRQSLWFTTYEFRSRRRPTPIRARLSKEATR
jgi:hypothetical protein